MVKYYLKDGKDEKEVKLGDCIYVKVGADTPFGRKTIITSVIVNEKSIEILKKLNYITTEECLDFGNIPFIEDFAKNAEISREEAVNAIKTFIEDGDYLIALYALLKAASLRQPALLTDISKITIFDFHCGKACVVLKPRPCDIVFNSPEAAERVIKKLSGLINLAYGR